MTTVYCIIRNIIGPDSSWFWTMVQGIIVSVSAVLIYRQLKAQHFGNMLGAMATLDERWATEEMFKGRETLCLKYGKNDLEIDDQIGRVLDFFEQMGLYLKKRAFTQDVIWEFYSYNIKYYWAIAEPLIKEFRSSTKDQTYYVWFEWLKTKMMEEDKSMGSPYTVPTKDEITKFISGEVRN
jgi:hypothetical protein